MTSDCNKNNGASSQEGGTKCRQAMTEEESSTELLRLVALGKEALENHNIVKAFDYLFLPAHVNEEALKLFLMIVNTFTRLYLLTDEQVAKLKQDAEDGCAISQYAYGRYLYIVRPDDNAIEEADNYFKAAEKAGMGDAIQAQSTIMLDGHYGIVDYSEAHRMTLAAVDKHSELGARAFLRRSLFGDELLDPDPQKVIDLVKKMFPYESNDISEVNPVYYEILGDAFEKIGDKRNAEIYYNKAINMGYIEAFGGYCYLHCGDLDTDERKKMYEDLLAEACESGDPSSYVYKAVYLMRKYESSDDEKKQEITAEIKESLETAVRLGSLIAPYFLGYAYYYGYYGFEEDNSLAWDWLIEGKNRDEGMAYSMLAQMISDGNNPYEVDDELISYCQLMALRDGENDQLRNVVKAYYRGELTDYAVEIERYYIPRYEALPEEEDEENMEDDDDDIIDDGPDDDGRYDAWS